MDCSWRRPIIPTIAGITLSIPRGCTSHDHRIRVPSDVGSKVSAPTVSIMDEWVDEARRRGWSKPVNSIIIGIVRRPVLSSARNRLPRPIGFARGQLGGNHPGVVARLVALVRDESEHFLYRPLDDDLAFDPRHINVMQVVARLLGACC